MQNHEPDHILNVACNFLVGGTCLEDIEQCRNDRALIISLNNTREPLYIVNRPANAPSRQDPARRIDKSLDLTQAHFDRVELRGDTDFSLTTNLDARDERCIFIPGMDARQNLIKIASQIDQAGSHWRKHNVMKSGALNAKSLKKSNSKSSKDENSGKSSPLRRRLPGANIVQANAVKLVG